MRAIATIEMLQAMQQSVDLIQGTYATKDTKKRVKHFDNSKTISSFQLCSICIQISIQPIRIKVEEIFEIFKNKPKKRFSIFKAKQETIFYTKLDFVTE